MKTLVRRTPAVLLAPLLALVLAGSLPSAGAGPAGERPVGDVRVLARVEAPGYPAHVIHHPNGRVYAGTFSNPSGDTIPSVVREWTRRGVLLRSWEVPGQDLEAPHGAQVATVDARGRLIVLDKGSGRILRLDPATGRWSTYSRVRDLPGRGEPVPNFAAWGPDGALYVTDYGQPVIWRVRPGGGKARAWFTSRKLDGAAFGTTGLALGPGRKALYVMQQSSLGLGEATVAQGKLYRLALPREDPDGDVEPPTLRKVWQSGLLELPDGFSFARSGRVYVALAGTNQIVVLRKDFTTLRRIGSAVTGANGSPVPFDTPSNVTFAGRSVLVANQSYLTGDPDHHAILDVYVGERGVPVFIPADAG